MERKEEGRGGGEREGLKANKSNTKKGRLLGEREREREREE